MDHEQKIRFQEYCYLTKQRQGHVIERLVVEYLNKEEESRSPSAKIEGTGNSDEGANNV